jgi:hypothetical protein
MEWYRVILSEHQIEHEGTLNKLKDQFLSVYMKMDDPADMALLSDDEYQNDRIGIYFSPACSPSCDVIIRFYGGAPCAPPLREECFVFAGDEDVLDSLR